MKKVFKLLAIAMVVFSFASTVTSCKKDDDNDKSCCSMEAEGETIKFCEGDAMTKAAMEEDDLTWDQYKAVIVIMGGTCD